MRRFTVWATAFTNRVAVRLIGAFLLITAVTVGVVSVAVDTTVDGSFQTYLREANRIEQGDRVAQLENYYETNGSWTGVTLESGRSGRSGGAKFLLADTDLQVVASTDPAIVGQTLSPSQQERAEKLYANGQLVGFLVRETPAEDRLIQIQQDFLDRIADALLLTSLGTLLLALILGGALTWWFARPLQNLSRAARDMAEGRLGLHVPEQGASELKQVARSFNRMSSSLAESYAVRQRMTSDIAHELRTPVSVMRTQLEGMLDGILPTDTQQVGVVYNQALHLARLVEDLRTLTRAETHNLPLEKVPVEVGHLIRQIVQDFEPLAQDSGIQLSAVLLDTPSLSGDPGRLRQVLSNLLANALHYTPAGGSVTITAEGQGETVKIVVTDTGPGLSPEQAAHIFDRFYRTDEARQRDQGGSGLGLAISRELIRLHGGELRVESEVGKGSQFIISL